MNLDELTLGQVKQLQCLLGAKETITGEPCCEQGEVKIAVLQRGWVFVGRYYKDGTACRLENSSVIRNWGTTQGLGEIASDGPTSNTKLDPAGVVRFNELTAVLIMDCEESKWAKICKKA